MAMAEEERMPDWDSDKLIAAIAAKDWSEEDMDMPDSPTKPPTLPSLPKRALTSPSSRRRSPAQPPRLRTTPVIHTPARSNSLPERRPMTSSTRQLSFSSVSTTRRPTKYGKGKHVHVELVPQPSDDDNDPLNWPAWKKELNYGALLLAVALVGVMKTAFVSISSQLATGYAVSYTAVAALTGVPLMLAACTGLASTAVSRVWGKRPVYLASVASLFIGAVWNTQVAGSFGQCMAARVFQGLGWGAFDTLEHQRGVRIAVYDVVAVSTTWGAPLVGGAVSASGAGFTRQFEVVTGFLALSLLLLSLGAPESTFNRSFYTRNTPAAAWANKELPRRPRRTLSREAVREYLQSMRPHVYTGPRADLAAAATTLLQAPRALVAPTTALLTLSSLLPFCALWGVSLSLGLLFSPLPFVLTPASLGALLVGPWLFAAAVVGAAGLLRLWERRFAPAVHVAAIGAGSLLSAVGLLAFGLYVASTMMVPARDRSAFAVGGIGASLSFPAISVVLGLLAAGAYVIDATVRPQVRRSAQFTSSNLCIAQRSTVDMCAAVTVWRSLAAGAFVMAMPNAVWFWATLKATAVGIAVVQMAVAALAAAAWWRYDETVRRLDGKVMRCVDTVTLKRTGSFFDTD